MDDDKEEKEKRVRERWQRGEGQEVKRRWQWRPERKQDQTAGDEDQNQNHTMIHLVQNDSKYFQNDTILHCGNTTRHPGDKNVLHVFCLYLRPEHRS